MYKSKKKFNLFVAVFIFLIAFLFSIIVSFFLSPNKVFALNNINSAVSVANGADLYDKNIGIINYLVVKDLQDKLFNGIDNPVSYIKQFEDEQTESYVLNAREINKKLNNNKGNDNGLVVKLDGKNWMVASLTLADLESNDNIIMTLYLADSLTKSQYNGRAGTRGDNIYSNSIVRNNLITDSMWSLFNSGDNNNFASNYLVKPKYIKYQQIQTRIGRGTDYHSPNEALHSLTTGWYPGVNYQPAETFNGIRYDAWGEDYIWLPSFTETGADNQMDTSSIWRLSSYQRQVKSSVSSEAWLRTANAGDSHYVRTLQATGNSTTPLVTETYGIRPAIHINLSKIIEGLKNGVQNPQDLETTYNEKAHTLSEIVNSNSNTDWYDKNLYETDNEFIKLTYPNNSTTFENAGDYWVKVEIKESWTNKITALVEQDALKYNWTEEEKQQVLDYRKPKFLGSADTSDSNHLETDVVRWIKITINKADLDFKNVKWSSDSLEYNNLKQSVTIVSGLPSFLTPTYSGEKEKDVNADGTFYTAKVIGFESTNSSASNNYKIPTAEELENIPQLQHKWKITKKKINVSWATQEKVINGIRLVIPMLSVDSTYDSAIEYIYYTNSNCTTSITLEEIAEKYNATQSIPYWVKATLKTDGDYNNTNSVLLLSGSEVTETISSFKVGEENNEVTVSLKTNKVTYNGSEQKAILQVSGGLNADALVVTYKKENGVEIPNFPTDVGLYKVIVNLKDDVGDFVIVGQKEFDFEIESLKVEKPQTTQSKVFKTGGFDFKDITNLPNDWSNYFVIKVFDKDNVEIGKVNNSWTFVGVNNYRIQIQYKNGMNTNNGGETDNVIWKDGSKGNVQVTLDIQKLVLTIDGWQDGEENGRATLKSDYTQEIEKYFDYVLYECSGDVTIGDALEGNAILKYSTDYQIALRLKNEYKGNVAVEYNGESVEETAPYKFKTGANPFTDGDGNGDDDNNGNGGNNPDGDGSDSDNNNGSNGKPNVDADNGMNSVIETLKNMPSYMWWILIAVFFFMIIFILMLIIILIVVKKNKPQVIPQQAIPYAQYAINNAQQAASENNFVPNNTTDNVKPKEVVNVKGTIVNNYKQGYRDWTFVVKESDILNLDLLESPQERILFYAVKESEAKKVKKLQNQILEAGVSENASDAKDNDDSRPNRKTGKRKKSK